MWFWRFIRRKLLFQVLNEISRALNEIDVLKNKIDHKNSENDERYDEIVNKLNQVRITSGFLSRAGFSGENGGDLYRAVIGSERVLSSEPTPIPLTSAVCQQVHFSLDQYRYWAAALKERPNFDRKLWEFFFIAQALFERGLLQSGRRGLAFGVGMEPLPALFASFGVEILATDQGLGSAEAAGWVKSSQHSIDMSSLNIRGICTNRMFSELVTFAEVDMNAIPSDLTGFDFCWSACSLEHLGSLRHGLDFIRNSVRTLKPGGIAVHTTEFNVSSNEDTIESSGLSVYRRRDIETVIEQLRAEGHDVEPVDWTLGSGFAEMVVDLPPWRQNLHHIRLMLDAFASTSIGLIIRRGAA